MIEMKALIYEVLSECFKKPTRQFAKEVEDGRIYNFLNTVFDELGISAGLSGLRVRGDVFDTLTKEYNALFTGPMLPYVVPVESVYKTWSNDSKCGLSIAGEKGYIMGDPAVAMLKEYSNAGIEIPREFKSIPDHITLELEYVAILYKNDRKQDYQKFVLEHLDWVADLKDEILRLSRSQFYRAVGNALASFIYLEGNTLSSSDRTG